MSILSASSAFTLNAKSQGLFSSHTAFKKPTFNTNFSKSSHDFTILSASAHPKDLAINQKKAVKICSKSEDPELIMCEPVKKVKLGQVETLYSESMNNKTTARTSRLTVEEVFNTPINRTQSRKGSLLEDCFDEGSSLSFISSHSSFDNLDDESVISRKNSDDCIIIGAEKKAYNTVPKQSLVVKDDLMGRLSYLNQEPMLFDNWESHSVFFGQDNLYQPTTGYLKTLPVDVRHTRGLSCNGPLCMPPVNEYIQFALQNRQSGMSVSEKVIHELVKNSVEDGYDSDSYATRSTSVEQETAEKGATSPSYSGNEDLYVERKVQQSNKQKTEKVRKQGRSRADTNNKEKKGRSLNLKLDLNPKQIKVQRRLNRLQLLRYQQGATEEEHEDLKQFGISDLISRGNCTIQESDEYEDEIEEDFDPEKEKAIIPELGEKNLRRRVQMIPVWNPENLEEEKFGNYLRQLEAVLENPVSDIEAAIKLLTSYGMNISLALEAVKENIALYSEVFRLKVKRLRRRGA